jgi:hypothetical protein
LLININKTYNRDISIYDATRKSWRLDKKRKYFEGEEVKDKKILELYLDKEYTGKKKGQRNPINYIWKDK